METISRTTDKSWEVLRRAMGDKRKWVAHVLRRSESQIHRWVIPPPSRENPDSAGEINPLDTICSLFEACDRSNAQDALDWLCQQFGGRFVPQDGGQGDGCLFRDLDEVLPYLQGLATEIKKGKKASDEVMRSHLTEAYIIIMSHLCDREKRG